MHETIQQVLRDRMHDDTVAVRYGDRAWTWREHLAEAAAELAAAIRAAADSTPHLSAPLAAAMAGFAASPDPGLGRQEQRALVLYASGRSIKEVAAEMDTTDETVKSYIKRARRKFREVGVDVGTRILLRRYGIREGWLTPE